MTTKRVRNANNANGAVEFLDDGTVQISDKTDRTKKLVLDASSPGAITTGQDGKVGARYYFPTVSSYIPMPGSVHYLPGSGDSTYIMTGKFKPNAAVQYWHYAWQASTDYIYSTIQADGTISFIQRSSNVQSQTISTQAVTDGKNRTLAVTRSDAGVQFWHNGVAEPLQAATKRTPSGMATVVEIGDNATSMVGGELSRYIQFNYSLDENKIRKYSAGAKLDYDDIGGSMVLMNPVLADQNFSSDTTFWSRNTGVTIGPSACVFVSVAQYSGLYKSSFHTVGKKYRITFSITAYTSGSVGVATITPGYYSITRVTKNGIDQLLTAQADSTGTWVFEYIALSDSYLRLMSSSSTAASLSIDDLYVIQLGAVLDLEPENITDTMWADASPNGLHGTVSGALANRFVPQYSTRNYIINGAMELDQRGSNATPITADGKYGADRWFVNISVQSASMSRIASGAFPSGWCNRITLTTKGAGTYLDMYQPIETANVLRFAGKTMTLSFLMVKQNLTSGSVIVEFRTNTTGTDTKIPGVSTAVMTIDQANIPTAAASLYSMTFKVPAGTTVAAVRIGMSSALWPDGVSAAIAVSDVMLNEGPVAAPFERAGGSIGGELQLCQRYYEKSYRVDVPEGTTGEAGYYLTTTLAVATGNATAWVMHQPTNIFKVPKRTFAYTARLYPTSSSTPGSWTISGTIRASAVSNPTQYGFLVTNNTGGTITPAADFVTGHWAVDAEL